MRTEESNTEASGRVRTGAWRQRGRRWRDVALPALLELAIAIPTMIVEESWHGRPMIDEHTGLWLVAGCLVAFAFLVGGALAGYRLPVSAAQQATVATVFAVVVLLVGAVIRRLVVAHEGVPPDVERLWLLGAVAALVLSTAGSELGRRLSPHGR
jgi:hypothetical protein